VQSIRRREDAGVSAMEACVAVANRG
jgi:hypothetical protein